VNIRASEIFKRIDKKIEPVYVFIEEESFLVEKAIDKIRKKIKEAKVFYYSNEVNIRNIEEELFSFDFFSKKKLVVLKNISSIRRSVINLVKTYSEKENKKDVLIVVDKNISKRKDWEKVKVISVTFWKMRKNEAFYFVKDELSREKYSISYDAFDYLYGIYNGELRDIFSDIEKAKLYLGKPGEIDIDLILFMEGRGKSDFDNFFKSLVKGDYKTALNNFNLFCQEKGYIMKWFYAIIYKLKAILIMKKFMREGFSYSESINRVRTGKRSFWGIERNIEEIPEEKFVQALKRLLEIQEEFLSGRYSDKFVFEKIIIELCKLFNKEIKVP